jgi:hypothetical protein
MNEKSKNFLDIETKYDSFHPNRIQIKLAKYILGVHKSANNIAVLGEFQLYPLSIQSLKSCINYWLYLVNTQLCLKVGLMFAICS